MLRRHVLPAMIVAWAATVLVMLAAAVALAADPAWYVVRPGDNLHRIADRFGTTAQALEHSNPGAGNLIHPGQRLSLEHPFAEVAGHGIRWRTPYRGATRLVDDFGPHEQDRIIMPRTGVKVAQSNGSEVVAPAHGVLRYLSHMDGLGVIAILDHGAGWHTVLGPLDADTVPWQPGQALLAGDVLGRTASPPEDGTHDQPYLHVELRRDGKAVHPRDLLR